jgi:hypothetical protein
MTYVFGVNLPLNEMMLIILVLLLAGFILLLVELRKLQRLIAQEKYDITRFENDLASLEEKGHHKETSPSAELQSYVQKALAQGITPDEIRNKLRSRGWHEEQISQALKN